MVNPLPTCVARPAGLVGWWRGEGNALDQAGSNNGTLAGNTTFSPGRVGQGFVFDGNGAVVQLGNPANLHFQDLTIETWISRASTSVASLNGNGNGVIFGYHIGGYGLYMDPSGTPTLSKIGIDEVKPGVTITDTDLHHVAVTKVGSTVVFYVDGVAYPAAAYDPGFTFSENAFIGGLENQYTFFGTVDEVSVYSRALAASEIQAVYNAGSAGKCVPIPPFNHAPVARIEVAPLDELPGITNLVSIAPVCCEATLRLDASKSTDLDNDALTYTWLEGTNVLSADIITTNRFKPGTHEFTLLVNDGKDVTAAFVTVEIITTAEAVAFLKGLVEAGIPEHRDRVPLVNWLREAGNAFDRCKVDQGVKFLALFNDRVQDRIAPTDPELATALMETATAIIEAAPDCDPCHRLGRHHHRRGKDKERDGREERDEHDKTGHDERDPGSRSERGDRTARPGARATDPEVRVERSSPGSR